MNWKYLCVAFSALIVNLCAQTDWDCNHYLFYPTDVCVYFSGFYARFECNGTDTLEGTAYLGDDCSGTPYLTTIINDTSSYQCDQSVSCDYVNITAYDDSNCTDYNVQAAVVIDECISFSNTTSYSYGCDDDGLFQETYFSSGNCSGFSITVSIDPSNFGINGSCFEVCNTTVSGTTVGSNDTNGTIGPFDCNVGINGAWPLAVGECSYSTEGGNGESYMALCADDGQSAILYEYNGTDCTGDLLNATYLDYFYCGSTSNCTMTTMSGIFYNDTSDCSGNSTGDAQFNLAQVDNICIRASFFVYYGLYVDDDSVVIETFFGDDTCTSPLYSQTFMDGCNQFVIQSGSINATFSTSMINQTGSTYGPQYSTTSGTPYSTSNSPDSTMSTMSAMSTMTTMTTNGDDDDDDNDTDIATRIGSSNMKQIFAFIIAIVVYKL